MRAIQRLLVLGAGYTGLATLRAAASRDLHTVAFVRREEVAASLRAAGHEAHVAPSFAAAADAIAASAGEDTLVAVLFPPDDTTDAELAHAFAARRPRGRRPSIAYVSSTGVYGAHRGVVDDTTPVMSAPAALVTKRLNAEGTWRALDATILRSPAIYGPDRGLHVRVAEGKHRIPRDGSGCISRIHVDDLAAFVLASPRAPGETFVVGDIDPAPHRDVVAFVCAAHGLPMPPFAPLGEVHESLRGDRRVDPSRALEVLGVTLTYPSYRTGMVAMRR